MWPGAGVAALVTVSIGADPGFGLDIVDAVVGDFREFRDITTGEKRGQVSY